MTNKKTTKRALIASLISFMLCFAMLLGTTYAWFTDSVSSTNNIIKSGNLDIVLEYYDAENKEWVEVDEKTNVFTDNLWEPGHTEVIYLRVTNAGSLALKYNLGVNVASETPGVNVAGETFKLSDYIEFGAIETDTEAFFADRDAARKAVTDAKIISKGYAKSSYLEKTNDCHYVSLVVFMPETVGNEANHKTGTNAPVINLGINLFATQYTYESDSFGTDYDETAPWVGDIDTTWYDETKTEFVLTAPEELAGLAKLVNEGNSFEGKTVKLGADLDLNNVLWTPIGANGSTFKGSFYGQNHTISNLRVVGSEHVGLFGATHVPAHIEGIVVDTAYVSGNDYVGTILGGGYIGRHCIVNCTVTNATVIAMPYEVSEGNYDGGAKAGVIAGQVYNGHIKNNTATDSTVIAYRDLGGIAGMLDFDGNATVDASGNKVENVTLSYVGVASAYDGNKPNQNMGDIIGRVGSKANVDDTNASANVTENKANEGAVAIYTVDELVAFAKAVNAGNNYSGKTVILGADIDLSNREWTPIGNSTTNFKGTFDGNGHIISNLKITGYKSDVGLFGVTSDGAVKNLTVENASVSGRLNVGVVAGTPYTSTYTNITVKGDVEVNGMAYVGAVGGKNAYASWTDVTVEANEGSYVKAISEENGNAYRTYVGGVVGFMGEGSHTFKNVISNIDVIGSTIDVGGITGIAHYGNSFVNCVATGNVTITDAPEAADAEEIGGIAGVWHNETGYTVTFTDCVFEGKLSVNFEEVDLSDNTITGAKYKASGEGTLVITNYYEDGGATYALNGVNGDVTLYKVPADYTGKTFNVAEGTDKIGGYAFAYNSGIETIVLPTSVTTLADRAFRDTSASKVVLNEGLTNISYQAFRNALNVTEVVIPSTVKTIGKEAFQSSGIKTLSVPATVETIENGAMRDMKELVSVTIEGNAVIPVYAFRACTNLKEVKLLGDNVTFGGKGMIFTNKENGDGSAITVTVQNEEIKARLLAADTAAKDYGGYTIVCMQETATDANGESLGYYVDNSGKTAYTYNAKALDNALKSDTVETIVLVSDVKFNANETTANSGYGATGVTVAGGTLDGNGNAIGITNWDTWDSAVHTTGGTIKNVVINSGMRGIFMGSANEDTYIDNVVIDGTIYTFNSDGGNKNYGVYISNSTLNGWTSFSNVHKEVVFTNCNFGEGNGYAFCRPYNASVFKNCVFEEGFEFDTTKTSDIVFENCYYGNTLITAENAGSLDMFYNGLNGITIK